MGPELYTPLIAILICLLLSAFFSASETAITAVSRARIYHLILEGNRRAQAVGRLRKMKERLIGGIMIGNNTVNILGAALATDLAIRYWGANGVIYATIGMTLLVVIFAEVLPKTYAIQNSEAAALKLAPAISFVLRLLAPFNAALQVITHNLLKLFGVDSTRSYSLSTASDVIRGTIELHHHEGQVVKQDRDMLGSILDMQDIEVGEIMVHRLGMEILCGDGPPEQVIASALGCSHSRIPVWQGEPDNIVGVLYIKTLIKHLREHGARAHQTDLRQLYAKPWFIPESTTIRSQLHAFRAARQHMALVVDEYGALMGLLTLEDIIEEIVGRIEGEHGRQAGGKLLPAGKDAYFVEGGMSIRDVNRELNWNLPDTEAATVAGLVIHEARLIPEIGEQFDFHTVRFHVLDKQGNQITRMKIEKLEPPPEAAAQG